MEVPLIIQYLRAKQAVEAAEEKLKAIRAQIEPIIEKAGGSLGDGNVTLTITEVERESFSLKDAKEKLDIRTLRPFITVTKFKMIRSKVTA